jgi:hypothetical protein
MESPTSLAFTQEGKERLSSIYAPASLLTEHVNKLAPGSRVLYEEPTPYGALLHGEPVYVNWYQPTHERSFKAVGSVRELRSLVKAKDINFAIISLSPSNDHLQSLLREFMAYYGYADYQEGAFLLYRISHDLVRYRSVFTYNATEPQSALETKLRLPVTDAGVIADADPKVLAVVDINSAKQARYRVKFSCSSSTGYFIAQINWNNGNPYYRLVPCSTKSVIFAESIPIPIGASKGDLYVTSRQNPAVR